MNAEAIIALVSLALGTLAWLFRQSTSVSKALVELGICKADVTKLQVETQALRDQSVRQDTILQQVNQQLSDMNRKLDNFAEVSSDAKVTRAIVERIERRGEHDNG